MEFRNLYYFLQLCEEKNYSSAAGKLYITQQALSKSIKALEKELGSALFTKTPQGIRLTAYGEAVYPICKDMIQHFEVGVQKIRSISADGVAPIRLAVAYQTADTLSFTLLDDFQRAHPGVRILSEALPDLPAEEAVLRGSYDFLLSVGVPRERQFFTYVRILPLPLCVMAGPEHSLYGKPSLTMADLDGVDLHCAGPQFKTYHLLKRKAAEAGSNPHLLPTSGHLYTTYKNIFSMNRAVIGIYGSNGEPEFSGIRQIPFADPELNWDIYFCCRKDYLPTRLEACFCRYILSFARDGADGAAALEQPGWALDVGQA